ncbi:hypothetical protein [Mycobacterium sp. TY815]|uniref:hypothetical protein n=1 Tax=Mycobacterium sp. TY815 TaxID=3050581 RepID=UPI00274218D7|nr:hypothetical protein [Mycobacterium sp. TY815]MDP7703236.1 hypothetical protein [Mycobacterium sp. TY815]
MIVHTPDWIQPGDYFDVIPITAAANVAEDSRCVAWIFTAALVGFAVLLVRWARRRP